MTIKINSNIESLKAQRQIGQTTDSLSRVFERLSTGQRINRASDDAAGLSISSTLKSDIRVYSQGIRNLNDGISLGNVAHGALEQLTNITIRQKELAEQSANGSFSTSQRLTIQKESDALVDEYNRIVSTTTFNGINLFDSENGTLQINLQAGYGTSGILTTQLNGQLSRSVGTATFTSVNTSLLAGGGSVTFDYNNDGKADILTFSPFGGSIAIGNGDGSFQVVNLPGGGGSVTYGDFDGDGDTDFAGTDYYTGNISLYTNTGGNNFTLSSGPTFAGGGAGTKSIKAADFNNDGSLDLAVSDYASGQLQIFSNDGHGSFTFKQSIAGASGYTQEIALGDLNGDGSIDMVLSGNVLLNDGKGKYTLTSAVGGLGTTANGRLADLNRDGILDYITVNDGGHAPGTGLLYYALGKGDGTFNNADAIFLNNSSRPNAFAVTDLNGDGYLDFFVKDSNQNVGYTILGNGNGTFKAVQTVAQNADQSLAAGDFNGDGSVDIFTSAGFLANTAKITSTTQYLDLASQSGARSALGILDTQLQRIQLQNATLGASESRILTAISTLTASNINRSEAYSRIMDVDVASESAELSRKQILQEVGVSVLAQANLAPQLALKLLKG